MGLRGRVLSDEKLKVFDGLDGADKRLVFSEIKILRKKEGYGGRYRHSKRFLTLTGQQRKNLNFS